MKFFFAAAAILAVLYFSRRRESTAMGQRMPVPSQTGTGADVAMVPGAIKRGGFPLGPYAVPAQFRGAFFSRNNRVAGPKFNLADISGGGSMELNGTFWG